MSLLIQKNETKLLNSESKHSKLIDITNQNKSVPSDHNCQIKHSHMNSEHKDIDSAMDTPEKECKTEHNINEDWRALKTLSIEGSKCRLVPYTVDHVQQYNAWLNDPLIQQMTQTEPYSLDQEYEYQKEWNVDETKYIFIILDRALNNAMCGDINVFVFQSDNALYGELSVMIAEDKSRRKGIATETVELVIQFGRQYLDLTMFVAKIEESNGNSIALFKKLGFVQTDFVDAFKEYTFTLTFEENENGGYPSPNSVTLKQNKLFTD